MKTNAFKTMLITACLATLILQACSSRSRNADEEGDTVMTDSANMQVDDTDTLVIDTSTNGIVPGGTGTGSSRDTAGTPNIPAP